MIWIAIRMLTGDGQKFYGLVFGIAFSTLLITQQLTIFVNLIERGASSVYNVPSADVWVMDEVSRTTDVNYPMPSTALDMVRSVPGVEWAVPHLRAGASVRSGDGDLEGVSIVGVDDATLIGLPRRMVAGSAEVLSQPDSVIIDDVGVARLFEDGRSPLGARLELNDQRAVIRAIADAIPSFTSQVTLYTKYSQALSYVPGTRNRLSFVLVGAAGGTDPHVLASRIQEQTGLRARTRDQFARDGVDFIIQNTGIPLNFGITVALGFIVGVAIVGLTFSLFIRDNIKQFGALKAIGVTNAKIRRMVADEQPNVARQRRHRRGKGRRVDAKRVTRGQQDVIVTRRFGLQDDVAAMFETGAQQRIGDAEKLVVVVAQRREPAYLTWGHGSFSPVPACITAYHCSRVQPTLKASAAARMRSGFCEPSIGTIRAGWTMIQLSAAATASVPKASPCSAKSAAAGCAGSRSRPPPSGDHASTAMSSAMAWSSVPS